jgi:predicted aldo/keto reductase-like oxidoreductase
MGKYAIRGLKKHQRKHRDAIKLYRKMDKVKSDLSILGFGCMRLPLTKDGNIDENQATEMLMYAIDHGCELR